MKGFIADLVLLVKGIVIGQMYPSKDAPKYKLGHGWSFAVVMTAMFLFTWVTWIYKRRNAGKEQMRNVTIEGEWDDRAPDFKYQT